MSDRVGILIEDVPDTLRAAVEADARDRDLNRNDVICEILAARFRIRYEPTRYPYRDADTAGQWMIRMPVPLREAVRSEARELSTNGKRIAQSRLVVATLQSHYGLPVDSPRRRPTTPPIDAAIIREARARAESGESMRSLSRRFGIKRETLAKAIRGGDE